MYPRDPSSTNSFIAEWELKDAQTKVNSKVVPWCALFADVDHEIEYVRDGVHVTALAYNIRRKDGNPADPVVLRTLSTDNKEKTLTMVGVLRDLMANTNFLSKGGKLGLTCEHLYQQANLSQ